MLEKCAEFRDFREGMVNEHPPVNQRIRAYIYRFHMELNFIVEKKTNGIDCCEHLVAWICTFSMQVEEGRNSWNQSCDKVEGTCLSGGEEPAW